MGNLLVGVDEVGRGALAGPVYAAAVQLKNHRKSPLGWLSEQVRDSKRLAPAKREALSEGIRDCCCWALGVASSAEIDGLGIATATKLAMSRAVLTLSPPSRATVLVDGTSGIDQLPELWRQVSIVGGDDKSWHIAAASIVAKCARDGLLRELDGEQEVYGWSRNKGYGTVEHRAAIATHGPSRHHRRSFLRGC